MKPFKIGPGPHIENFAAVVLLLVSLQLSPGQMQTNVTVSFTTTNTTPLNPGFAGFCTEFLASAVEYGDTNMQALTATLSPGWLRYPGGTIGDAFAWTNGMMRQDWINEFPSSSTNLLESGVIPLAGNGGAQFTNFVSLCQNVGGAKIVVCINGFTDNTNDAWKFARFALTNHTPVSAWELCNEPYTFQGQGPNAFFRDATDYASQMKPFRDAIKAADSNAVVALFYSDFGLPDTNWDNQMGGYSNQYWDAVIFHHFTPLPAVTNGVTFADVMALDNWQLASNSTCRLQNYLMPFNTNPAVTYLNTAFSPARGNGAGTPSLPSTTLYGGIYTAEYVLRMSMIPQVTFMGPYQLLNNNGIDQTNGFYDAVQKACHGSYVTNTIGLPFGFFLSAQAAAEAVAYWALYRSDAVINTSVDTNCPTVPIDTNGVATMPALYAQAYRGNNGKKYVVLTNKGSNSIPVQLKQDGLVLSNNFSMLDTFVTSTDPSVANSNPPGTNNVSIQTVTVTNPVTIPPYSVVRLEWTVFPVPPATLSLTVSKTNQNLFWSGLTNVTYNVQGITNLLGSWTTLGRVANPTTNFNFTSWNSGPHQFYRLFVP